MGTKATAEKTKTSEQGTDKKWKKAPGAEFPPFVKFVVGSKVTGVMSDVEIVKEEKKRKGKTEETSRVFFRMALTEATKLFIGPEENKIEKQFGQGETITLPDHGHLQTQLARVAAEIKGVEYSKETEPDFSVLKGMEFQITRLEDQAMKKGKFKNKKAAMYEVQYAEKEVAA